MEEATNRRVRYVYIPDLGPDGLNEFARYFYPQLDKEALIIDDLSLIHIWTNHRRHGTKRK